MKKIVVAIVSCMLLAACQQQDKHPKGIDTSSSSDWTV